MKINKLLIIVVAFTMTTKSFAQVKYGVKAGLNFDDIRYLEFINPPLEVQKKYSDALTELRSQEENNRLKIDKTNSLFNSLIQKAFKGELVS